MRVWDVCSLTKSAYCDVLRCLGVYLTDVPLLPGTSISISLLLHRPQQCLVGSILRLCLLITTEQVLDVHAYIMNSTQKKSCGENAYVTDFQIIVSLHAHPSIFICNLIIYSRKGGRSTIFSIEENGRIIVHRQGAFSYHE